MGRLLESLRERSGAAIPASPAIPDAAEAWNSRNSGNSRAAHPSRVRLLDLAVAADLDPKIVDAVSDSDAAACDAESDAVVVDYLRLLVKRESMAAGFVPAGWNAVVECRGCGPVYMWPECPAQVIACSWCVIRKAGKPIPRPNPQGPRPLPQPQEATQCD